MTGQYSNDNARGIFGHMKHAGAAWLANLSRQNCHSDDCGRWTTVGVLRSRRIGVWMSEKWYCSWACFAATAQRTLAELTRAIPAKPASLLPPTLGIELMSASALNADQLREINEVLQAEGGEFGQIALRKGFVTEEQVAAARAALWGCPVYQPPPGLEAATFYMPSELNTEAEAVPLHFVPATRQLLMGFLHRVDYELMYAIETITDCKICACFLKASDYRRLQQMTHGSLLAQDAHRSTTLIEDAHSSIEQARILCDHGVQMKADRVKITRCKSYVWARLEGESTMSDLLFRLK